MTNIAYKVSQGDPNLPDGFIIEHFATKEDSVEGYTVVELGVFNQIFANNHSLYRTFEQNRKNNSSISFSRNVDPKLSSDGYATNSPQTTNTEEDDLYKQFLAWKALTNQNK